MDRKYRRSLMLMCIMAVFCLLVSDDVVFFQTETAQNDEKSWQTVSGEKIQHSSVHFSGEEKSVSNFPEIEFTVPGRTMKRLLSRALTGTAVMTVLVSRRYFLYVPKEERFFTCFQPAIFLCARFLRELLILFKKDGKNGEFFLQLNIIY